MHDTRMGKKIAARRSPSQDRDLDNPMAPCQQPLIWRCGAGDDGPDSDASPRVRFSEPPLWPALPPNDLDPQGHTLSPSPVCPFRGLASASGLVRRRFQWAPVLD